MSTLSPNSCIDHKSNFPKSPSQHEATPLLHPSPIRGASTHPRRSSTPPLNSHLDPKSKFLTSPYRHEGPPLLHPSPNRGASSPPPHPSRRARTSTNQSPYYARIKFDALQRRHGAPSLQNTIPHSTARNRAPITPRSRRMRFGAATVLLRCTS